tara:strand:+ start:42 stop:563 length:522 start_codon:yes stop_codon:yes gene_type:complete
MIEKIITFIEIIILIVYGLYNYIKNYVIDIIHRNKHEDPPTLKSDNVTETFEDHSQNQQEELNENIESKTSFNIYRPNDFYSYNINDYNDYSISKNQPDNLVLPKNYAFQTQEFEKDADSYDYKDFNNIDGAGVHLYSTWKTNPVNRPWFETCLSPMNCQVVEGDLEKFNYNN